MPTPAAAAPRPPRLPWLGYGHGPEVLKQLFVDLAPRLFSEPRQGAEPLVRGAMAMAIGTTQAVINDFKAEGLAKNLKQLPLDDFSYLSQENVWLVNRAPHPNAAKLYVNWLLSKEGGEVFCKELGLNSRRADIPVIDASDQAPEGAEKRFYLHNQKGVDDVEETRALTRELLK